MKNTRTLSQLEASQISFSSVEANRSLPGFTVFPSVFFAALNPGEIRGMQRLYALAFENAQRQVAERRAEERQAEDFRQFDFDLAELKAFHQSHSTSTGAI